MVRAYVAPLKRGVAKVKFTLPVPPTTRLSPPLSCNVSPVPRSPEIEPPTGKTGAQTTCILVTLAVPVPVPVATLQVWIGLDGFVLFRTLKLPPLPISPSQANPPVPEPLLP